MLTLCNDYTVVRNNQDIAALLPAGDPLLPCPDAPMAHFHNGQMIVQGGPQTLVLAGFPQEGLDCAVRLVIARLSDAGAVTSGWDCAIY